MDMKAVELSGFWFGAGFFCLGTAEGLLHLLRNGGHCPVAL